jgi:hypothetical protein
MEFNYEPMILYEYRINDEKGMAYENLSVFLENNKGQSITKAARKWKKQKKQYSPLPPNDLINCQYSYLVNRKKKDNLEKKNALKGILQRLSTMDYELFK